MDTGKGAVACFAGATLACSARAGVSIVSARVSALAAVENIRLKVDTASFCAATGFLGVAAGVFLIAGFSGLYAWGAKIQPGRPLDTAGGEVTCLVAWTLAVIQTALEAGPVEASEVRLAGKAAFPRVERYKERGSPARVARLIDV